MVEATSREDARTHWVCGPDPDRHAAAIGAFVDARFDEVHVLQIGPQQASMIEFYAEQVIPALG